MEIKNINIYNIYPAILGIRNSFKSKDKSDSIMVPIEIRSNMDGIIYDCNQFDYLRGKRTDYWTAYNTCEIGKEDEKLIKRILAGKSAHQERKFLRQILVSMDIIGSIKFWSQHDTFKIATVRNSESTMHSLVKGNIDKNDFEREINPEQIKYVNNLIELFNKIKSYDFDEYENYQLFYNIKEDKEKQLKKLFELIDANLPAGYVLESHWTGNYENLINIYHSRKNHKMYWWKEFCSYIEQLPYFELLIKGE